MGSPGQWSQHQPERVQEVFGQCSQACAVTPGDGLVQSQELDLIILVGRFQPRIFCVSVICVWVFLNFSDLFAHLLSHSFQVSAKF